MKKQGYDATSIREICEKADVSVGAFYLYFGSKDDVLSEMLRIQWKKDERDLPPSLMQSGESVYVAVENLMCHWAKSFGSYASDPEKPRLFPPHFFHKHIISSKSPFFARLEAAIALGQRDGSLSSEIPAREICWKLIRFGRGIVQDWILREQEFELTAFLRSELRFFFRLFSSRNFDLTSQQN